jgi:hypothetical protein
MIFWSTSFSDFLLPPPKKCSARFDTMIVSVDSRTKRGLRKVVLIRGHGSWDKNECCFHQASDIHHQHMYSWVIPNHQLSPLDSAVAKTIIILRNKQRTILQILSLFALILKMSVLCIFFVYSLNATVPYIAKDSR